MKISNSFWPDCSSTLLCMIFGSTSAHISVADASYLGFSSTQRAMPVTAAAATPVATIRSQCRRMACKSCGERQGRTMRLGSLSPGGSQSFAPA